METKPIITVKMFRLLAGFVCDGQVDGGYYDGGYYDGAGGLAKYSFL